jgi:hypothetical protein
MGAVPLPAAPGPAPGAVDPREATYWATAAELGHQYEHTLAADTEVLADDKALMLAKQGTLDAAQPTDLTNIRNKANAEGLLSSGIEQQRTGLQQAAYTRSRGALSTGFQQESNKESRAMSEAGESYTDKMRTALAGAEERQSKKAEEQASKDPTLGAPPPSPSLGPHPGAEAAVKAAFPGGTAEQRAWIKQQAAKKVAATGGTAAP